MNELLPVIIDRKRNLVPKTATYKNEDSGLKISRMSAIDVLRFKKDKKMTHKQATQIAEMVNTYNDPAEPWQANKVLEKKHSYEYLTDEQLDIIGAIRLQKRNINHGYLSKLCVREQDRKKGHGRCLLSKAEQNAKNQGFRKITANIRRDNEDSRRLFNSNGYKEEMSFYHCGKNCFMSVWTKEL